MALLDEGENGFSIKNLDGGFFLASHFPTDGIHYRVAREFVHFPGQNAGGG